MQKKKIDNLPLPYGRAPKGPQSRITAQMEGHFGWDSPETGILQYFAKSFFGGGGGLAVNQMPGDRSSSFP